jgi:putative intracellular protease/amidase
MFDLSTDTTSQQVIKEFYESSKIISAVCHGPAALLNVKLSDGSYLIKVCPKFRVWHDRQIPPAIFMLVELVDNIGWTVVPC